MVQALHAQSLVRVKKPSCLVLVCLFSATSFLLRGLAGCTRTPSSPLQSQAKQHAPDTSSRGRQEEWATFSRNFKAQNADYQAWCEQKLAQTGQHSSIGSQFEQDSYLIRNVFANKILKRDHGFYIDSGANDPEKMSNTLFFDVCLGWSGLCIEPNEKYHQPLKSKRSCTVVPVCISDKKENVTFLLKGSGSGIKFDGGKKQQVKTSREGTEERKVLCEPLDTILDVHSHGRRDVDLWSLDVEGHEMAVLKTVPWSQISFSAILVETFWLSDRIIDRFMTELGFAKAQQLAIDSLYVRWNAGNLWRPARWDEHWQLNQKYREEMRKLDRLSKDY